MPPITDGSKKPMSDRVNDKFTVECVTWGVNSNVRCIVVITDNDNDQLNFEKFSGSDGIQTVDFWVTSPLLFGLLLRASVKCSW